MSNQHNSTASRPWLAHSVWILPVVLLATLTALMALGQQTASAQTSPRISIDKSIGLSEAVVGSTITYTLRVTNSGNTALQNVVVVDNQCTVGTPTKTGGDTDNLLESAELWTYNCVLNTAGKTPGTFENTATATGETSGGLKVQASDKVSITLLNTGVHVTKTLVPGQDPIVQGETVAFTITVRNTSAVTITKANVSLVDSVAPGGATCAPLTGPTESHPASVDLLRGSVNGSGTDGEIWTYVCSITNVLDDFTNTVAVTTKNAAGQTVGTHSASANAKVLNPGLTLEKSANKATITTGETVTWTFKVANTGEITLTTSAAGIVDNKCTPIAPASSSVILKPGEQKSFTCARSYAAGDIPADGIIKNTAVVTANTNIPTTPASLGQLVKSASGQVTALKPGLEVGKTTSTPQVAKNGTAKFTMTAKNTGQGDLSSVTIEDPMCTSGTLVGPTGDNGDGKINPGETWSWTCEAKNVTADFANVVVIRAKDVSGVERNGVATAYVDMVDPGINIVKGTIEGATVTIPDSDLTVNYGMTATFQISVTNKDVSELSSVNVTDLGCDAGTVKLVSGDNGDKKLQQNEVWKYTCTKANVFSDFENVASVTAVDVLGVTRSATSDKVKVNVNRPDLRLTKKAAVPFVEEGKAISWTLTISNVGQLPLTTASITTTSFLIDPVCKTLTPTTRNPNTLNPGNAWTFVCTADPAITFLNDKIKNTATAVFKSGATTIIDTDSAEVDVYRNSLNLKKNPRSAIVLKDSDAIFDFSVSVVSRPGTPMQTLSNVVVEDALCPGGKATYKSGDNGDGKLQSTEVWSFECTVSKVQSSLTNTAKASALDANNRTVSDIDSAALTVINAQLTVKKSTGTPIVNPGANVTFDIEVSNTGDNTLINVVPADSPSAGACTGGNTLPRINSDADGELSKGETWKYTCTIANVQNDLTNNVVVTAKDKVSGLTITASDPEVVSVLRPGINLEKTPDTQTIIKGQNAIFELKVSNTGNTDITSVKVTDDLCAQQPVLPISGDTDGDSVLDKGETWVYPCTVVAVTQNLINSAAVTGVSNNQPVADTDTALVIATDPAAPAIDVTKSGPASATAGSSVTFQIGVRNAGNVALTAVNLTDSLGAGCPLVEVSKGNGDATLDVGEQWNYTCTASNVVAGTLSNTASATAQGPAGQVNDSATAVVVVTSGGGGNGSLVLAQTVNPATIVKGGSATFRATLANGTATDMTGITLSGDKCKKFTRLADAPGNNDAVLNSGETWVWECVLTKVTKTTTNKVTAKVKTPKQTLTASIKLTVTSSRGLIIDEDPNEVSGVEILIDGEGKVIDEAQLINKNYLPIVIGEEE